VKGWDSKLLYKPYEGYLFILPWLLGFLIFSLWPMIYSIILAFSEYSIFAPMKFNGIANFREMFSEDKQFIDSLKVTVYYVVLSVPIRMVAALLVAIILNQKLRGISVYRTVYYLPSIVGSGVAMSVAWRMFLCRDGLPNVLLSYIGLGPFDFITSPDLGMGTLAMISAWQFGAAMVIFLAGLKAIPAELYEAARVDGSSRVQQFFKITIPLLSPTIFFNLVMSIIGSFQVFTQAFVITEGGPAYTTYVYVLYLYRTAFENFRMGYSSALAWILTIIVMGLTVIMFRTSNKWVYYES